MMKQNRAIQLLRSASLAGLSYISLVCALAFTSGTFMSGGLAMAETSPGVNVGVYAMHSGGKTVYHYRAINNTPQTIAAISIGHSKKRDVNPNIDIYELNELPSGWNEKIGIPAASSNSPTGWRVSVTVPTENSVTHAITWEPLNNKSPKFLPGQTLAKMSITLDKADATYMAGNALITFDDGYLSSLTVPIERLDSTPPSFSVNLSPNTILLQDNKQLVAINASFTTKDDYDRLPEIKLESITANEPMDSDDIRDASIGLDDRYLKFRATSKSSAGRTYTVTYSATDASGNQTSASATVTVTTTMATPVSKSTAAPHNQGEKKNVEIKSR